MVAPPCPVVVGSETQLALVDAVHAQSREVSMASDPEPPASGNVEVALAICTWHFCELGAVTVVEV